MNTKLIAQRGKTIGQAGAKLGTKIAHQGKAVRTKAAQRRDNQRHNRLTAAAKDVVSEARRNLADPTQITPAQVVHHAFGRYGISIELDEAATYLANALAA